MVEARNRERERERGGGEGGHRPCNGLKGVRSLNSVGLNTAERCVLNSKDDRFELTDDYSNFIPYVAQRGKSKGEHYLCNRAIGENLSAPEKVGGGVNRRIGVDRLNRRTCFLVVL